MTAELWPRRRSRLSVPTALAVAISDFGNSRVDIVDENSAQHVSAHAVRKFWRENSALYCERFVLKAMQCRGCFLREGGIPTCNHCHDDIHASVEVADHSTRGCNYCTIEEEEPGKWGLIIATAAAQVAIPTRIYLAIAIIRRSSSTATVKLDIGVSMHCDNFTLLRKYSKFSKPLKQVRLPRRSTSSSLHLRPCAAVCVSPAVTSC